MAVVEVRFRDYKLLVHKKMVKLKVSWFFLQKVKSAIKISV